MNSEKQRIAIAEACGWTPTPDGLYTQDPAGLKPPYKHESHLPNYVSDLNAMHEAERVLTANQTVKFVKELYRLVCPQSLKKDFRYYAAGSLKRLMSATAAQRAEAFLKTLNLWEETK